MDPFHRQERQPGCLSQRTISLFVTGELEEAQQQRVQAHLGECASCARRVAQERHQVEEARTERIPEAVLKAGEQRPRPGFNWSWTLALAGAAAAVLVLTMLVPSQPPPTEVPGGVRIKGQVGLLASVERQGERIADEAPFEQLPPIRAGDAFRLKVTGPVQPALALRGCEDQTCQLLYQGKLPPGGWLPLGLTATPGKSRLELIHASTSPEILACLGKLNDSPAAGARLDDCDIHAFELTVGPAEVPD
jgi:hypothetical protein